MKLTTKGRYAVTAMLDLASCGVDKPTSLAEISNRQSISLSYLEQIFGKLRRSGLVRSVRGPGGGYMLDGSPTTITVADIIRAVDEPIQATSCGTEAKKGGCNRTSRCITHDLWVELGQHIYGFLDAISLDRLAQETPILAPPGHLGTELRKAP
ncbi:MAG: Rrf2 family transcriptional regulator [Magnetococcales bacterium]|nr:Rrf2 family transcriptional regulator [Magnetococcales bacterium]